MTDLNQNGNKQNRSKDYLQIMEHRALLQSKASAAVTFSKPLIEREGQGIIYPRTINVLQGKTGVHKSRLVEEFCSTLLAPSGVGSVLWDISGATLPVGT